MNWRSAANRTAIFIGPLWGGLIAKSSCAVRGCAEPSSLGLAIGRGRDHVGAAPPQHRIALMDLQLTGKRALICGGSSGLGRAVATALVAEGAHVALLSRDAVK